MVVKACRPSALMQTIDIIYFIIFLNLYEKYKMYLHITFNLGVLLYFPQEGESVQVRLLELRFTKS